MPIRKGYIRKGEPPEKRETARSRWILMPEANDKMTLFSCGKIRRIAKYIIFPKKIMDSPQLLA